ncbi:MAG: T9SS type A sorting domain-containing protein [Rhizobacter sp.]|nr:T9SS type A sorting domain-containing protein [Ferruginibacter sp.]
MKKLNFTFLLCSLFTLTAFSQTTYYWTGGNGPASFTSDNNWNTQLDGLGNTRVVAGAQYTDVLIFDGSNVGGATPATGNVVLNSSSDTVARMIFQNNVNVQFSRSAVGSSNISIQGEGTALADFVINGGSVVTLGDQSNYNVRILLGLPTVPTTASGSVSGIFYISPLSQTSHTASYITSLSPTGLVFENGGECHVTDSTTVSPFNGSGNNTVLFKTGSSLHYYSGRSPFGNSSAVQFANFETGSNFYVKGSNVSYLDGTAYASSSWVNQKSFANVIIQNGDTLKADGPVYRIDNLTIDNASYFITHTSGQTPVLGNLTVNGFFTFPSGSNGLVMGGHSPQTISGTGVIEIPNFTVANFSDVILTKIITVTSATNIVGKINFGTNGRIAGAGTFTSRVASIGVGGTGTATAGSYQLSFAAPAGITGYSVTGPGLSPNTNVIGFGASANIIYLSKPALSTQAGGTYSFETDTATLQTANANGFDIATGSVTGAGSKSYQTGTNYIIDAATSNPFGISTTATGSVTLGDLVVNAPITTNYNTRLAGTLTLNSGILNIRALDTVRILNGTAIQGAPFSSAKYIVSNRLGNDVGVLRVDGITTAATLPIGTAANFLPVTITVPSAADFAVSVFEGVTIEGTTAGTAFSASQKSSVVDAVWTIDRITGTGTTAVTLNWTNALEGSAFASYPDVLIGVARHNGTAWEDGGGTGNNTINTATHSFDNFSPFIVTRTGSVLPVDIHSVSGTLQGTKAHISWNVSSEISIQKYEVEKSTNRTNFVSIGFVNAAQRNTYAFTDPISLTAITYYRLKIIGLNGEVKYSEIVVVKPGDQNAISFYPNPVTTAINISGLQKNSLIRILNIAGVVLLQQKSNAQFININVEKLKPGSYVLEVLNDGVRTATNNFVK